MHVLVESRVPKRLWEMVAREVQDGRQHWLVMHSFFLLPSEVQWPPRVGAGSWGQHTDALGLNAGGRGFQK